MKRNKKIRIGSLIQWTVSSRVYTGMVCYIQTSSGVVRYYIAGQSGTPSGWFYSRQMKYCRAPMVEELLTSDDRDIRQVGLEIVKHLPNPNRVYNDS